MLWTVTDTLNVILNFSYYDYVKLQLTLAPFIPFHYTPVLFHCLFATESCTQNGPSNQSARMSNQSTILNNSWCQLLKLESERQFAVECLLHPNLIREKVKSFASILCTEAMSSFREMQLPSGFFSGSDTMHLPMPPPLHHNVVNWVGHCFFWESPESYAFDSTWGFNHSLG